jgi:hypothetical protein
LDEHPEFNLGDVDHCIESGEVDSRHCDWARGVKRSAVTADLHRPHKDGFLLAIFFRLGVIGSGAARLDAKQEVTVASFSDLGSLELLGLHRDGLAIKNVDADTVVCRTKRTHDASLAVKSGRDFISEISTQVPIFHDKTSVEIALVIEDAVLMIAKQCRRTESSEGKISQCSGTFCEELSRFSTSVFALPATLARFVPRGLSGTDHLYRNKHS